MNSDKRKWVYLVFRQGVYRHECLGVLTELDRAIVVAEAAAAEEVDDYHSFAVVPFVEGEGVPIMQRTERSVSPLVGEIIMEHKPVAIVTRVGEEVKTTRLEWKP